MAAQGGTHRVPQVVLSLLLGLLLVAIVGAGVRTLYPLPGQTEAQLQKLTDQQKALDTSRALAGKMGRSHAAYYKKVADQIAAAKKALESGRGVWYRNTSIILVAIGALFMGLSLIGAARFRTVSDGSFLGGLFTVLYGVYWSFTGDPASTRYAVLAVAVVLTLAIGYLKFVRGRKTDQDGSAPREPAAPAA